MYLTQSNILLTLALTVVVGCPLSAQTNASEEGTIMRACQRLFHAPVDETNHLFEINEFFACQVKFTKSGKLGEIDIKAKYFFSEIHPKWNELPSSPVLSHSDYQNLLASLDTVRPKGSLILPRLGVYIITQATNHYSETYRNATLEVGEATDWSGIRFFRLTYP
jgi:hypothetical protein